LHFETHGKTQRLTITPPSSVVKAIPLVLTVAPALTFEFLDKTAGSIGYTIMRRRGPSSWVADGAAEAGGRIFTLQDHWTELDGGAVRLERTIRIAAAAGTAPAMGPQGVQIQLPLGIPLHGEPAWRFFAPAMLYEQDQWQDVHTVLLAEERLAAPLFLAYREDLQAGVCLRRMTPAAFDEGPKRTRGEQRFLHKTDVGALGFSREEERLVLRASWPYCEGERSAQLNSSGTPVAAFYPLVEEPLTVTLAYEIQWMAAPTYGDAVFSAFAMSYAAGKPAPVALPFTVEDSVAYRTASLARTYHEWGDDGACFQFNFDPRQGYESPSTGFGATFKVLEMDDSRQILEYGFTGRQLNAAYVLAQTYGGEWLARGRRAVDFFVRHFPTASGWLFSMYHLDKQRPLYTVGDPDGPIMHYLARPEKPGNYLRTMVEVAYDLLLNYRLHRDAGSGRDEWLAVCLRFADFLVRVQEADGSWRRAYEPDGTPLRGGWFGATEEQAKSGTAIPVAFLLACAEEAGEGGQRYVQSARLAGDYALAHFVEGDKYRGGTLDNPNVVDKEAALYAMGALLRLYAVTGEQRFLEGSRRAANLAVTWNHIWTIPNIPGTAVAKAAVNSLGWGGINSTWGAGVTDIYTLFFVAEFVDLARLTGEPFFAAMADLIARGVQQILSHPGDLMGFTDIGMQPEGISFCPQGVDDGMIAKGDIWGGLGWIYTAGTFGVRNYLRAKEGEGIRQRI
jgi:hypothetical protein